MLEEIGYEALLAKEQFNGLGVIDLNDCGVLYDTVDSDLLELEHVAQDDVVELIDEPE